ncbi:MAG: spore germination protein [Peptococcaceae bacterium]|nr:spore germination protein [Peptococcaceae bacterium]
MDLLARSKKSVVQPVDGKQDLGRTETRVWEPAELERIPLSPDLQVNITRLKEVFDTNPDFIVREFDIAGGRARAALVFIKDLVERSLVGHNVLKSLMLDYRPREPNGRPLWEDMKRVAVTAGTVKEITNLRQAVEGILEANAVLFLDGEATGLVMEAEGFEKRPVGQPETEAVVRGPREGFVECLAVNITMLRRWLKSPNLQFENMFFGRVTRTRVALAYIKGLVDPGLVDEVRRRLRRIDIDGVFESNYLETMLRDSPYSPFPQMIATERPDKVAANLLDGRVAILTEGTPFVLVLPAGLVALMQSPEDYYHFGHLGSFIRLLRWMAFGISLLLPSLYVAVTTFHQEMLPTRLLLNIVASREGVPLPAVLEALLMEVAFEVLREAGVRLPRAIGQAVSIVGVLVIGDAAVTAGLVSPQMVIVVAFTGITSFLAPAFDLAISIRLLRFPVMLMAGTLGLFGVISGVLAIFIHLAGLRSFGVPYLAGLVPFHSTDWKDILVRFPMWTMRRRPAELAKQNRYRMAPNLKPGPARDNHKKE